MKVLIIQHVESEGPGLLYPALKKHDFEPVVVDARYLPSDLSGVAAVISLGGPMNVYDDHPFLKREELLIREVLEKEIPFLGVCLGAQMLAKAAGAEIIRSPMPETGWFTVGLTQPGIMDPLFWKIDDEIITFQLHGDMFNIPETGILLATSERCPHQALKVGKNAYGLQFHMEVTLEMALELVANDGLDTSGIQEFYNLNGSEYLEQSSRMFSNFITRIIHGIPLSGFAP